MGRLETFYERSFARLGEAIEGARERASLMASERGISRSFALALVHAQTRQRSGRTAGHPRSFVCDGGLGGLARWLRAIGYGARWDPALDDPAVIREAQMLNATLVTTDSLMMERGILRDGAVPTIFVPSSLTCEDQLVVVVKEMNLAVLESRCMACGGELQRVDKAAVLARIPPKTALWLDEYFVCSCCDRLYWRGTHWKRIVNTLARLQVELDESARR